MMPARPASRCKNRRSRPADFFPEKKWDVLAVSGYMCPDPYSGAPGVEEVEPGLYRVTVRLAGKRGDKRITFTLRLGETLEQSWLVFNPLLNRFMGGEDYEHRPVRISDSGRIRNELQTLCSEALEFPQQDHIRVHFDRIPPEVIHPPPRSNCWRSCAGTKNTTRSGSPGSTSPPRKVLEDRFIFRGNHSPPAETSERWHRMSSGG